MTLPGARCQSLPGDLQTAEVQNTTVSNQGEKSTAGMSALALLKINFVSSMAAPNSQKKKSHPCRGPGRLGRVPIPRHGQGGVGHPVHL